MTFCEHLVLLRTSKNLFQKDVAAKIGVTTRAYQRYEYGEREPQLSALLALADFYDLPLDELVCRKRR